MLKYFASGMIILYLMVIMDSHGYSKASLEKMSLKVFTARGIVKIDCDG